MLFFAQKYIVFKIIFKHDWIFFHKIGLTLIRFSATISWLWVTCPVGCQHPAWPWHPGLMHEWTAVLYPYAVLLAKSKERISQLSRAKFYKVLQNLIHVLKKAFVDILVLFRRERRDAFNKLASHGWNALSCGTFWSYTATVAARSPATAAQLVRLQTFGESADTNG